LENTADAIVIGAGAAGLMCAGAAARRGRKVLLLEKMERPARKLLITGKGRCNVTNDTDIAGLLNAVRRNPRFLYSAFSALPPASLMALLENELNVPLKTERGQRVFPISDKAADVAAAMVKYAQEAGAKLVTGASVKRMLIEDGVIKGVVTRGGELYAESVAVATGGLSYPRTGSTGDGYKFARQAGHTVTELRPSLVSLTVKESFCRELAGLSLKNCSLTLRRGEKALFSELGEMLFTHTGISGPLVLSASAHIGGGFDGVNAAIDLKPGLSREQLDARVLRDFSGNINRDFGNSLAALLPRAIIPVIIRLSGINPGEKVHDITKAQRKAFAELLKRLTLTPKAFRPIEEAVVTSGGVNVREINPKTMESKLVKGLFFAGEVLDVDAYTGGFNLQAAFSTGYLAGMNI
jgi:predicted Rossmann fold flavoprotein